jgi:hypothetical protein
MCWRPGSFPVDCPAHIDVPFAFKPYCHRAAQEGLAFRGVSDQLRDQDDYQNVKWNRGAKVSSDTTVRGHRHDQTVAGVLAARLGMRLSSEWLWVTTGARRTRTIGPMARGSSSFVYRQRLESTYSTATVASANIVALRKTLSSITSSLWHGVARIRRKTCKFFVRPASVARETVGSSSARMRSVEFDRIAEAKKLLEVDGQIPQLGPRSIFNFCVSGLPMQNLRW